MTQCQQCRTAQRRQRAQQIAAEIHSYGSGWIVAAWDDQTAQWTGESPVAAREASYCYSVARTLAGLAGIGVTVYRRRASALRALEPPQELAECAIHAAESARHYRRIDEQRHADEEQ